MSVPASLDGNEDAARKLALLHDASTRIGGTLDLGTTASEIVDVAVPRLADAAGVFALSHLVTADDVPVRAVRGSVEVRRLAVRGVDHEPDTWAVTFPVDEVVVYPEHNPYARCLATGESVRFDASTPEGLTGDRDPEVVRRTLTSTSFLAVPLRARGRALGFVALARIEGRFSRGDVELIEEVADRAAVCIDNARLYRRERRTAVALQECLLPRELTAPPGIEIAHHYLPAGDAAPLGGDWYDAVALSGGRVALIVGDAMGHGSVAAAAMVQLRTALRTLASLNLPPADALYRLDRLAHDLAAAQFATCVYATCDPATGMCVVASAGHLPPILVAPDGTTTVLRLPPGLPLGVGGAPFEAVEFEIPANGTLVLYTDGLVERRERDLDEGIARLRQELGAAWAGPARSLSGVCRTIGDSLAGYRDHVEDADDITLLLVRLSAPSPTPADF